MLYGNDNQVTKATEIRLGLRIRLMDAINRLKVRKSSPDLENLLERHIEALEYIDTINSAGFLLYNQFYSVPHILKLKKQKWNGIYK